MQPLQKAAHRVESAQKPALDLFPSYLATIENSVGTNLFRKLFYRINNSSIDVLEDGDLSCAVFVSSILYLFDLIGTRHTTVNGTIEDLEASGWRSIDAPRLGAVILWGFKKLDGGTQGKHRHLGFYLNAETAISNSSDERIVARHHLTYGFFPGGEPRRDIQAYFWHDRLNG